MVSATQSLVNNFQVRTTLSQCMKRNDALDMCVCMHDIVCVAEKLVYVLGGGQK